MSDGHRGTQFEKKVLAELTGDAKIKAEGIEIAARAIVAYAKHSEDSVRGQMTALKGVLNELQKLSLPRTISFVGQLLDIINDTSGLSPAQSQEQQSENSYVRRVLSDLKQSYEHRLSVMLAEGPVPPEKQRKSELAFLIPRS
jgi:hypothetical protein